MVESPEGHLILAVLQQAMVDIRTLEDLDWLCSSDVATAYFACLNISPAAVFQLRMRLLLGLDRVAMRQRLDARRLHSQRYPDRITKQAVSEGVWQSWPALAR